MDSLSHMTTGALVGASAAQLAAPEALLPLTLLGVLAGSIPDIDFLSELHGKVAAWRYHRVASHNISIALSLSVLTAFISQIYIALPLTLLLSVCVIATSVHLFLDLLTSFGTCLLLPFNQRRFSFRSHFIVDPIVLIVSLVGTFSANAAIFSALLISYLLAGIVLRGVFTRAINGSLPAALKGLSVHLEPSFLAPLRWLVIVRTADGYAFCYQTLIWRSEWFHEQDNNKQMAALCQQDPLMREVLKTFDMPIFKLEQLAGVRYLVIEDIKWRTEPGLRPLAFTAKIQQKNGRNYLSEVTQRSFFQRADHQLFHPPARLN